MGRRKQSSENEKIGSYERATVAAFETFSAPLTELALSDADGAAEPDIRSIRRGSVLLCEMLIQFGDVLPRKMAASLLAELRALRRKTGPLQLGSEMLERIGSIAAGTESGALRKGLDRIALRLGQGRESSLKTAVSQIRKTTGSKNLTRAVEQMILVRETGETLPAQVKGTIFLLRADEALEKGAKRLERIMPLLAAAEDGKSLRKAMRLISRLLVPLAVAESVADTESELRPELEALEDMIDRAGGWESLRSYLSGFEEEESRRTLAYYGSTKSMSFLRPGIVFALEQAEQNRSEVLLQIKGSAERMREGELLRGAIVLFDSIRG